MAAASIPTETTANDGVGQVTTDDLSPENEESEGRGPLSETLVRGAMYFRGMEGRVA